MDTILSQKNLVNSLGVSGAGSGFLNKWSDRNYFGGMRSWTGPPSSFSSCATHYDGESFCLPLLMLGCLPCQATQTR